MTPPSPLDALTVARFEEGAQAASAREIARESIEVGAGVATFTEPGSSLNQAWNQGLHGPVNEADIDEIVRFFADRNVEPRLPVCALADPSLVFALASRGFVTDAFINVFAVDLRSDAAHGTAVESLPSVDGMTLEIVDSSDDDRVAVWARTSSTGFHDGAEPPGAMLRATTHFARKANNVALLARVDAEPAGTAVLSVTTAEDGTVGAGLFGTSVLPAYRGRGIQSRLIAERLRLARDRNATLATIGSNPGVATERNAARFGFALSYVKAVQSRPLATPREDS